MQSLLILALSSSAWMAWRVGKSVRVCGYEWTNNSFCRKHSRSFCLSCMHLYVLLMRIYMCKCTKRREPSVCKVIRLCLAEAATDRRWTVGVWASEFAPFFFAFDVKPCLSGAAKPREVTACWEDEGRKTANEAASSLRILPSLYTRFPESMWGSRIPRVLHVRLERQSVCTLRRR